MDRGSFLKRRAHGTRLPPQIIADLSDALGVSEAERHCTYHDYWDGWQNIEQRNGSNQTIKQMVWGLRYIDELVQVALNDDPADGTERVCESKYWAMQDVNYNVLGIADDSGGLIERYEYEAYGKHTVFSSTGANDPGCYNPRLDSARWTVSGASQPYGLCEWGWQGTPRDSISADASMRNRSSSPQFSGFISRDPAGYDAGGMNLYELDGSSPVQMVDPFGLAAAVVTVDGTIYAGQHTIRKYFHSQVPDAENWEPDWSIHFTTSSTVRNNKKLQPGPAKNMVEAGGDAKDMAMQQFDSNDSWFKNPAFSAHPDNLRDAVMASNSGGALCVQCRVFTESIRVKGIKNEKAARYAGTVVRRGAAIAGSAGGGVAGAAAGGTGGELLAGLIEGRIVKEFEQYIVIVTVTCGDGKCFLGIYNLPKADRYTSRYRNTGLFVEKGAWIHTNMPSGNTGVISGGFFETMD